MAGQRGKDLLLKLGGVSIGGLRTKSIRLNNAAVDITDQDSTNEWQELLANAGTKTAGVSGSGVFKDSAAEETVRSNAFSGTIGAWTVIIHDFGTITMSAQITELTFDGAHDGEVTFSLALQSSGAVTW